MTVDPAASLSVATALAARAAEEAATVAALARPLRDEYDVVVIGSGPGGATVAHALATRTDLQVLLLERGPFLPAEPQNWDSRAVLVDQVYANSDEWLDRDGRAFQPHMYHYVGGMTKLYAGTLLRLREADFDELELHDGLSPAWPISYDELEPYYAAGEALYLAHGEAGADPTEPARSGPFPYPAVPVPPEIETLRERLSAGGLRPFPLPQGLDLREGGRCLCCGYCDSHPCEVLAKGEPELVCIRPALQRPNFTLLPECTALRLSTDPSGSVVTGVEVEHRGERRRIGGSVFVVACGAVGTPALLLRSASERHPQGLGNSSGLLGRHYMRHLSTLVLARHPELTGLPQDHYWKSVGIHDWYLDGGDGWPYPLGAVQFTGNYHEQMPLLLGAADHEAASDPELAAALVPIFVLTEDLALPENRVSLTPEGMVQVAYRPTNVASHRRLLELLRCHLEGASCKFVTSLSFLEATDGGGYHHSGTARFGDDPRASVLDRWCKAHDLDNLYVADASFMPSCGAANPVLTIVANALRVAEHLIQGRALR